MAHERMMTMTTTEARAIFDKAVSDAKATGDRDRIATAELLREYFTNPTFRQAMSAEVYAIVNRG
jgi:hypothetical protein